MGKVKFYSLSNILQRNASYNVIFGERSNGKTYAVQRHALEKYCKGKGALAVVRRWADDLKGKRAAQLFDGLVANGEVTKLSGGKWDKVVYKSGRWYLARYNDEIERDVLDAEPFAYAFAISGAEHDKSISYPSVTTIHFDEFLTRGAYLPDEFVLFMSIVSTVVRHRDNVEIFLTGNTVNKFSPYFQEMGLRNIAKMNPGDIDVYRYGDSRLTVAVEYSDSPNKRGKPSDFYFAFDNPRLQMITGGAWELAIYPHCPCKYLPKDVKFTFFVVFEEDILQCEVVRIDRREFIFVHRKTSDLRNPDKDLIYCPVHDPRPNWRRKLTRPQYDFERKIVDLFRSERIYYQDNEIGEIMRNYLVWCQTDKVT